MTAPMIAPKAKVTVPPPRVGTGTANASLRLSAAKNRPISGLINADTRVLTMPVKAAPMTTATARSMTLPRRMNSRNPLIIAVPS